MGKKMFFFIIINYSYLIEGEINNSDIRLIKSQMAFFFESEKGNTLENFKGEVIKKREEHGLSKTVFFITLLEIAIINLDDKEVLGKEEKILWKLRFTEALEEVNRQKGLAQ